MTSSKLITPGTIGPLKLRNRTIRSAAFEGMCPDGVPSESLINYHRSVAAGGIGMTTVAYVSVADGGRTFSHQAWMRSLQQLRDHHVCRGMPLHLYGLTSRYRHEQIKISSEKPGQPWIRFLSINVRLFRSSYSFVSPIEIGLISPITITVWPPAFM